MGSESSSLNKLSIKIYSGDCQSYQLYDHHANHIQQQSSVLKFPSYILKNESRIRYSTEPDESALYQIHMPRINQIKIVPLKSNMQSQKQHNLWKIIRNDDIEELEVNDLVRIGKAKLRVKEIKMTGSVNRFLEISKSETQIFSKAIIEGSFRSSAVSSCSRQQVCKFCFSNSHSSENPLVNLCKCSGSMKLIHYQCLKQWVNKNIIKKESASYLYYEFSQPKCELCLEPLGNDFQLQGKRYSLFDIQKIHPPYIAFEALDRKQEQRQKTAIYFIKLSEGVQIKLGRSHQCQVMIKDISVSRIHCSLVLENKRVFLRDKGSKFGTLMELNKVQFQSEKGLQLQLKTKIIKIEKEQSLNANCCCVQGQLYTVSMVNDSNQKLIGIGKKPLTKSQIHLGV